MTHSHEFKRETWNLRVTRMVLSKAAVKIRFSKMTPDLFTDFKRYDFWKELGSDLVI